MSDVTDAADATPPDLPTLPPQRDARVNARLVRVMFYLPGFLALLLLKGSRPEGYGVTVELLMLSSVAAIVAGLLIGSTNVGKTGGDAASRSATWAGQVVLDVLAFVPLLMAVPPLFHTLTLIGTAGGPGASSSAGDPNTFYGASELIPAAAIIPWAVFELAGYSTLAYLLEKSAHIAFVIFVGLGVIGGYLANRNGWYAAELSIDGGVVLVLSIMSVYGILALKERQERYDRLVPPVPPKPSS